MVPVALIVGVAATAVPHLLAAGYVAGIATDPLRERSRRDLLAHVRLALKKLPEIGRAPSDEKSASLRKDVALLQQNVVHGWHEPHESMAAMRLSRFMGWEHTKGTLYGTGTLAYNTAEAAVVYTGSKVNEFLDWLMAPMPSPREAEGNVRA